MFQHHRPGPSASQPRSRAESSLRARQRAWRLRPLVMAMACLLSEAALAAQPPDTTWLSLEELMSIEVSSAAKRPQRLAEASTAIYAIGREEIRRSGATNIPDLLRTVPGVHVAQIDASRYAISIRGFSNRYSGKLLVLQDGRSLYNPLFSGTYWEAQDVVLEDVERIEVIRGSGGTLWGANAVNGVINIITRNARDSQGTFVEAKGGSLESGVVLRHGGELGEDGHFRAYAKLDKHDPLETPTGQDAHDAWDQKRAGFRVDLTPRPADTVTIQGDAYETDAQQRSLFMSPTTLTSSFVPDTARLSGANLLARWQHQDNDQANWQLQAFVDHTQVDDATQKQHVDTFDIEWQHRLKLSTSQDLTWGLGYRNVRVALDGSFTVNIAPPQQSLSIYTGFVQDEIRLRDDLLLTLGTKLEHNDDTGYEVQPSARLQWRATPTDNFWAAVSRSVQTPSVAATSTFAHVGAQPVPMLGSAVVGVRGNPDVRSEVMLSREIGYRGQFGPDVSLDLAAFYNTYDRLVSREMSGLSFAPYPLITMGFDNLMEGKTYGIELAGNWQLSPAWRMHGSYSWLKMDLRAKPGGQGVLGFGAAGSSPEHMLQLHSLHKVSHNLELDAALYFSSQLSFTSQAGTVPVEKSTRFDLRLGWQPSRNVEVNLIGRNLLDKRRAEFIGEDVTSSEVPRSLLLQAKWKF
ncbi:TonB-dependent receptor [Hydrogenophaga sp.]|uniref:TonB-dependent receptor plug domain-containing protein n=1 Tax=Hydrogenophaga sp. TaxID=1904254 RepID=UPI0026052105|nr:TonB-dependent receptor [Hydrogenophaga sp.]MDM7949321.1 TonB-dependent receptor [Hydrogenophaga sp.]